MRVGLCEIWEREFGLTDVRVGLCESWEREFGLTDVRVGLCESSVRCIMDVRVRSSHLISSI